MPDEPVSLEEFRALLSAPDSSHPPSAPTAPVQQAQAAPAQQAPAPIDVPVTPQAILPSASNMLDVIGSSGTSRNAPPPAGGEEVLRRKRLGEQPGTLFHTEGVPMFTDIGLKLRSDPNQQITYLAQKYGADNVRMNELDEPVVKIKGEDYVVDPHTLTLNSLTGLSAYAPEVLASALAMKLGGPGAGLIKQAVMGAAAGELAGAGKDIATRGADSLPLQIPQAVAQHMAMVPLDATLGVAMGGAVKAGQLIKGVVEGKGLPNPLAGSRLLSPSNPELTREGVDAAQRLAVKTGVPAELSPAEATGIPLLSMFETRQENIPAGASALIAARTKRDAASKAWQNWMIKPDTLGTDEEVARRGLGVLKESVDPFEKDVALAKFAHEAEQKGNTRILDSLRAQGEAAQQAKIVNSVGVSKIPSEGVPLTETGDLIKQRVLAARDASYQNTSQLYDKFYANPAVIDPVIPGKGLKTVIDDTLKDLPKVVKGVEEKAYDTYGNPIAKTVESSVPVSTPIRSRLEELSGKLADGKVSINDLKQIRTDVGDAITRGEAVPGVREGRLKQLYGQISGAIEDGIDKIGDPELKTAWTDATAAYKAHAERFSDRNLAPLFRDADQAGLGNAGFTRKLIAQSDSYNALKSFLGSGSAEIAALHNTVRNDLLAGALADGSSTAIDGKKLIRSLESLRSSNPELYQDTFANRGNQLIQQGKLLLGFQQKLPGEELEALLNPANPAKNTLVTLQAAEKRLADEYKNGALKDFLTGDRGDLHPDQFIRFLPSYKLSDVKNVMGRLLAGDPEVADQMSRKAIQAVLSEARRNPTPSDTLHALQGKAGDIVSGSGIKKALGVGDQLEKYKALLGPDLFETLIDYSKRELLREEKDRVGSGAGRMAKGQAVADLSRALTPGEGKSGSLLKEMGLIARDKTISIILASPQLKNLLLTPHTLESMPKLMGAIVTSEPFIKAAAQEWRNPGAAYKNLSILKGAFGTGNQPEANAPVSEEVFQQMMKQQ